MNCKNCQNKTNLFFCPVCGTINDFPAFLKGNKQREALLESYIKSMVDESKKFKLTISERVTNSDVSDAVYRKYYEHLAYLQDLCSAKNANDYFNGNGEALFEKMNLFAQKCKKSECQIAVVGTIKAGKSAFINSLLGREIASSYPTPETASLTKFRLSTGGNNYVKISFYTRTEWEQLWHSVMEASKNSIRDDKEDFLSEYNKLNADSIKEQYINKEEVTVYISDDINDEKLKKIIDTYTSKRCPEHFFAKEVEVGISDFFAPSNVVFVDTPGLNDPVSYRRETTKQYLKSANIILVCVSAENSGLRLDEIKQLEMIFAQLRYAKERIFVFGTQIDKPSRDFLDQWENYTLPEWLKYMKESDIFGSEENARNRIFPITAFYYLAIQEAKANIEVWKDKKKKGQLTEIIQRCLDFKSFEDLVDEYGQEEALKRFRSPQNIFYEHMSELEEVTQVPQIRNMLLSGPINMSEEIIKNDIKDDYNDICSIITNTALDVSQIKEETIDQKEADIKEQISNLTQRINDGTESYKQLEQDLHSTMLELQRSMNQIINKLKD